MGLGTLPSSLRLDGETALITGSASGLGRATTMRFSEHDKPAAMTGHERVIDGGYPA